MNAALDTAKAPPATSADELRRRRAFHEGAHVVFGRCWHWRTDLVTIDPAGPMTVWGKRSRLRLTTEARLMVSASGLVGEHLACGTFVMPTPEYLTPFLEWAYENRLARPLGDRAVEAKLLVDYGSGCGKNIGDLLVTWCKVFDYAHDLARHPLVAHRIEAVAEALLARTTLYAEQVEPLLGPHKHALREARRVVGSA